MSAFGLCWGFMEDLVWEGVSEQDLQAWERSKMRLQVQLLMRWSGWREITRVYKQITRFVYAVSLRHRGRSAPHTHTHLPLLPLILLHSSSSSSSSCAQCLVWAPTEVEHVEHGGHYLAQAIHFNPLRAWMASAKPKSLHWNQEIVGA